MKKYVRYSSIFLNPAVDGSGQLHTQAALPPEKESRVLIGHVAAVASETVWTMWRKKSPAVNGNRTTAVQPIAHLYID
jgi:hypothetical protein